MSRKTIKAVKKSNPSAKKHKVANKSKRTTWSEVHKAAIAVENRLKDVAIGALKIKNTPEIFDKFTEKEIKIYSDISTETNALHESLKAAVEPIVNIKPSKMVSLMEYPVYLGAYSEIMGINDAFDEKITPLYAELSDCVLEAHKNTTESDKEVNNKDNQQ